MNIDALIVGGGAAGLFALQSLRRAGFSALLVENHSLGYGQTTSSQGILHAGVKYSLGGLVGDDAKEASDAAQEWVQLLGDASSALHKVRVLTKECYLWRTSGFSGAAGMLGAKLALRTRPQAIEMNQRPAWLAGVSGEVLSLGETVIDPQSLLQSLTKDHEHCLLKGRVNTITQRPDCVEVSIESSRTVVVRAKNIILSAGVGNEQLLSCAHESTPPMQRRPLRQAMICGALPMVFGHCIDGAKTRITVTSDHFQNETVWHIGGQIAEDAITMSETDFATNAMNEVRRCLPAINFQGCRFASYDVLRAEPSTKDGRRPPKAFISRSGAVTTVWPVKLVLAPMAARMISESITNTLSPRPSEHELKQFTWPTDLPRPALALRPWETASWSTIS